MFAELIFAAQELSNFRWRALYHIGVDKICFIVAFFHANIFLFKVFFFFVLCFILIRE